MRSFTLVRCNLYIPTMNVRVYDVSNYDEENTHLAKNDGSFEDIHGLKLLFALSQELFFPGN